MSHFHHKEEHHAHKELTEKGSALLPYQSPQIIRAL